MDFFEKAKKLPHGHLRELAGMCAATALLLVAAVFIAGGGTARIGQLVATNAD